MVNELKSKNLLFPERTVGNDVINKNKNTEKKKKKRSPGMLAAIVLTFLLIVLMVTLAFFTSVDEVTNVFDAGRVDIILTESEWKPAKAKYVVPEQEIPKNPKITNNEKTDVYVFLEVTVPFEYMEIEENSPDANKGQVSQGRDETKPVPLYKFGTAVYDSQDPPKVDHYTYDTSLGTTQNQINSGWMLVPSHTGFENPSVNTDNKTITYVYAHVDESNHLLQLMPGHTTANPLFDSVKVINFDEHAKINNDAELTSANSLQGKYKNISVQAYGIQANYLGVDSNNLYGVWSIIKPATTTTP